MSPGSGIRLYRALLRVFPADFRGAFGADMVQLFRDRRREASGRPGAVLCLWAEALADIGWHATKEWSTRTVRSLRHGIREVWTMDGWMQDIRFGARMLLRRPGFALAAIVTLALGIGATVSIFSVVNGVLLRPLPFPDSDRLVVFWGVDRETGQRGTTVDHPDIRTWQEQVAGLDVAGYNTSRPTLTGFGSPEVVQGAEVTDGLITLLGYAPHLGRDLVAADDVPDGPRVVVVSHAFWSERLGADPDAIGRTITLSGNPWEIVGVAPAGFDFPRGADVWAPRRHQAEGCAHGCRILSAIGRLAPDASLEEVQAALDGVSARLASEYPDSHRDDAFEIEPMLDYQVADVKTGLWVLFAAVGMVLLIACANVANLMLARAGQRRAEVALRASLGAGRARIVRQLLTESLLLAALAGLVGLLLSSWGTSTLVSMAPESLPRLDEARLDLTVVGFTAALVLLVTCAFGVFPALHLGSADLRAGLTDERTLGSRGSGLSRATLIAGEVGLSLALLLGAGLLFRTLVEIRRVDYGFAAQGAERFRVSIPESRYDSLGVGRFLEELEARLGALPGVDAVGSGFGVPLASGTINASINLLDRPEVPAADRHTLNIRASSPGLLEATGTPLLAGRWFTADDRYGSEPVAVINQAAARLHYPDVDPIGRTIEVSVSWAFEDTPPLTIVGVIGDVRSRSATGEPEPALYLPNAQFGANSVYVWMRLRPGVTSVLADARGVLAELDPDLAITDVSAVEEVVSAEVDAPRFYLTLLAVFSGLALVLASIGLYGVVAYSVSQRRREIGIRIALGAASGEVVGMVVRQGARPVVAGIGLGLLLSLLGMRVLRSLLYGVEPFDPLTVTIVTLLLAGVTLGATLLPARRASHIPPAQALRTD